MPAKIPVLSRKFSEKAAAAEAGYRPLTPDELEHLGYTRTSRRYTTQKAGIRKSSLKREKTLDRRKVREEFVIEQKQEKYAEKRRAASGGHIKSDTKNRYARDYARINGISVREAQKSKEFQRLVRVAKKKKGKTRTKAENKKRILALRDLGVDIGLSYEDLIAEYYPE